MSGPLRLLAWLLALVVVALPLVAVLNGWMAPQRWPIRHLSVTAEYQRVSVEQVRATVSAQLGQGYFDTDPAAVRRALAALPWVRHAEVRKRWPDRLEVVLVEHRARAHWGEHQLLSDDGVVFDVPGAAELAGLPFLEGPVDRMAEVVAMHERARQQLAGIGLVLEGTRLSLRGSWRLRLKGGVSIVLGRAADPELRLARLVRVLPRALAGQTRAPRRIDLRYANGFAIAWAEPGNASGDAEGAADAPGDAAHAAQRADLVQRSSAANPQIPSTFINTGVSA